jgi:hypothetical protein
MTLVSKGRKKTRPLTCWARGPCALGTPSAWIFLVRLHACRAGLRFSRQCHSTVPMGESQRRRMSRGYEIGVEASFTSRSRAGLRLHPGDGHGAWRRRRCEWEQPHTISWRSAVADDAEWMSGKSRDRLAFGLDRGFLMDVRPPRGGNSGLSAHVDITEACKSCRATRRLLNFSSPASEAGKPDCGGRWMLVNPTGFA